MSRSWALSLLAVTVAFGCTPVDSHSGSGPAAKPSVAPEQKVSARGPLGKVITTLQTRDHEVTVYATSNGPRFTIAAAGGVVLAEQLTNYEFAQSFPGLHRRYDSAFAEDGAIIDASLTLAPTDPSLK